jgi:hypothetical protein
MREDDLSWKNTFTRRGTPRVYKPRIVNKPSDADFILERIEHDLNGGCWLWSKTTNAGGYGVTNRGLAHRLAYKTFIGDVPAGQLVCHSCDVRSCVNPAHLWLGTHKDNADDMMKKQRGTWCDKKPEHLSFWHDGNQNPASKLNSRKAEEIRASFESKHDLAAKYGVSVSTIARVLARSIWK